MVPKYTYYTVVTEEEVEYVEVEEPHIIDTGDSVKVKQVLDDACLEAVQSYGYEPNYRSENIKMLLMVISCGFALAAQFYPIPFPQSRPLLGLCCAGYFIMSAVFQLIITFVDKDTIITTKAHKTSGNVVLVRANFPRFQEYYSLVTQSIEPNSPCTTSKMYVGKYFTSQGAFDQVC